MEIAESSLLEIWEIFSDYVPAGKRNDVAVKFLRVFTEQDIDVSDLDEVRGEDEHLDYALDELESNDDFDQDESKYDE